MEIKQSVVGSLKIGNYVVIDGMACVIKDLKTSKGRHGHAKTRIEATGLMGNQKKIIVKPNHDKIGVPMIEKKIADAPSAETVVRRVCLPDFGEATATEAKFAFILSSSTQNITSQPFIFASIRQQPIKITSPAA